MRVAAALCLCVLPLYAGQAQDWNCNDPDNLPQQGMNYCASVDFNAADAELNAAWKTVFPQLKTRDADVDTQWKGLPETVLKAQRAWIKFRDAHCTAEGFKYRGGSIEPLIYHSCRAALTRERTKQITSFLEE